MSEGLPIKTGRHYQCFICKTRITNYDVETGEAKLLYFRSSEVSETPVFVHTKHKGVLIETEIISQMKKIDETVKGVISSVLY